MESEYDRGEQTDLGVWRFDPYLKQAVIEVGVDGFALVLSSNPTCSTTVAVNLHPRFQHSAVLLPRGFEPPHSAQTKEDRVQNPSTLSKPPTDRTEERLMCCSNRRKWIYLSGLSLQPSTNQVFIVPLPLTSMGSRGTQMKSLWMSW